MSISQTSSNVLPLHVATESPDRDVVEYHLALIIGRGSRSAQSRATASRIVTAFGIPRISTLTADDYQLLKVSKNTASILVSAFRLSKRVDAVSAKYKALKIGSPTDVNDIFGPLMRDLQKEEFRVLTLRTNNTIINDEAVSSGGLSASIVEARAVFKKALADNAASIICIHNHPSGNPEPSRQDIAVTKQLVEAGKIIGIPVRDHVIIAGHTFVSLAELGYVC